MDFKLKSEALCAPHNAQLLFLSHFGSYLYGTNTPSSDVDIKGIFLPYKRDLLLIKECKHIGFTTGDDHNKNSANDMDVELWSIHYFLELVSRGETGAIDLLYSLNHPSAMIYMDYRMVEVFENPLRLFNPCNTRAFIGYAIGQANKYGLKGTRLKVIKDVYDYMVRFVASNPWDSIKENKLKSIIDDIAKHCENGSYCKLEIVDDKKMLRLLGKVHQESISLEEFKGRVDTEYEKYGKRSHRAMEDSGRDWKALSHALRVVYELKEILSTGTLNFPLENRDYLKQIKAGFIDFDEVSETISNGIDEVETLQETYISKIVYDHAFREKFILSLYNYKE